jgi:hypothetical protein
MSVLKFPSFRLGFLLAIAATFAFVPVAVAQDDDKPQEAVIMFDIDVEGILGSALVKSLPLDDALGGLPAPEELKDAIMDARRVTGMLSLPESVEDLENMQGEMVPMDFAASFEFNTEESLNEVFKNIENDSKTFEKDGVTYYQPPRGESNLCVRKIGTKGFEIGTVDYVTAGKNRDFATKALAKMWKAKTKAPLQIAIDIEGAREFFDSINERHGEEVPAIVKPYVDLHESMDSLHLSLDPDASKMLTIVTTSNMADDAETVLGGFEAIIGLAKQGAKAVPAEQGGGLSQALAGGLKAENKEGEVTFSLTKPKNLEKMIGDLMKQQ